MERKTIRTKYQVDGMDCASCATKIDTAIRRISGVTDVVVSVSSATMVVDHDRSTDLAALEKRMLQLGYPVRMLANHQETASTTVSRTHEHDDSHDHAQDPGEGLHSHNHNPTSGPWWKSAKGMMTLACGSALLMAYAAGHFLPAIAPYAFVAAMLVGLIPIARRAIAAALAGTPFSIEMLMTIAALGAVVINAAEEAAAVVFLFLVGELLEGVAAGKARASIQSLAALVPKTALLEENGQTREITADSLAVGDVILVRPGDRVPADGVIVSGESTVNEAPVTGESTPARKGPQAKVFAATVNGEARCVSA